MPSLFDQNYATLIRALPVGKHAISVEAAFWQPKFQAARQAALWKAIFAGRPHIRLCRERLLHFDYPSPEQKSAEVLLWGYPRDMRGIVTRFLPQLSVLSECGHSAKDWPSYFADFPEHIGISSITKIAYFHKREFGGLSALILDSRLIHSTPNWPDVSLVGLRYDNAHSRYLDYLRAMHAAAADPRLACAPDQLEFFLFSLGNSF